MSTLHAYLASGVIGALAAAASVAASPAHAGTAVDSRVTSRASDRMPASGQMFRLRGTVSSQGRGTPATITVKTLRAGDWVPLAGATMRTDGTGHYTIRVVLVAKGSRRLRVVAHPDGRDIRASRRTLTVSVGMPGNATCD